MLKKKSELLAQLQQEAKSQARLEKSRLLPLSLSNRLSSAITLVAYYPWQTLLVSSFITALIVKFLLS